MFIWKPILNLHFITNMMKTRVKALITTPSNNLTVVAQLTLFLKKMQILRQSIQWSPTRSGPLSGPRCLTRWSCRWSYGCQTSASWWSRSRPRWVSRPQWSCWSLCSRGSGGQFPGRGTLATRRTWSGADGARPWDKKSYFGAIVFI